jgi:hypothetical protein
MSDIRNERINNLTITGTVSGGGVPSLARAIAVQMTASTTVGGIRQANDVNINPGTSDFTIMLGSTFFGASTTLVAKRVNDNNRWRLGITGAGVSFFTATVGGVVILDLPLPSLAESYSKRSKLALSVRRETATAAGEWTLYVDGVSIGSGAITAAATASIDNSAPLFICAAGAGPSVGTTRSKMDFCEFNLFNRALTAAEVLDLAINGPALSERGASQTPFYVSDFSAGVDGWSTSAGGAVAGNVDGIGGEDNWLEWTVGTASNHRATRSLPVPLLPGQKMEFTISTFKNADQAQFTRFSVRDQDGSSNTTTTSDAFSNFTDSITTETRVITNIGSAPITAIQLRSVASLSAEQTVYIKGIRWKIIGLTSELLASNAQSNTGQIIDTSGNRNHALLPASGATIVGANPARSRQVRSRHQWTATNELQYLSGVNQEVLPPSAAIEFIDIFSDASVSVNIGNGTTATQYASAASLVAGWNRVTLASAYSGTTTATRKLTITPTSSATAILNVIVTYHASEVEM